MKVLFIGSKKYDYMQDIVYSGLIKILGFKNVFEYNWNKKYHIPHKKYPKNLGYFKYSFFSSIHFSKRGYDLVILAATKPDCFKSYINLAPNIPSNIPVVWIDGGDRPEVGGDLERLGEPSLLKQAQAIRNFDLIFKREMKIGQNYPKYVYPLTFGFNLSVVPERLPKRKKYDVAFWAGESHPIRTKVLNLLHNQFDCNSNGTSKGVGLASFSRKGTFYLEELSACKINLSFRGGGFDTLRYWEIPAVGSLLISEPNDIQIPDNFEHQKHAIFCDSSAEDLINICNFYLKENDKREKIAIEGKKHLHNFHTDEQRAKFILKKSFQ
jgi:glycosyl transferase family 1